MPQVIISKNIVKGNNWDELSDYELIHGLNDPNLNPNKVVGILSMLSDNLDENTLSQFNNLKVVGNYAVGFNNIDIQYCKNAKIAVGNTPGVLSDATSDLAITLLFSALRRTKEAFRNVKDGNWKKWEPLEFLGQSLRNKTIGIFGMGRIGESFARKLHYGWDCKIIYHNRSPREDLKFPAKMVSFDDLLAQSQVLSIHSPFNIDLLNKFSGPEFSKMKKEAILINTSRGQLVNEDDLFLALTNDEIFAAAVDVTNPEPMNKRNKLLALDNFYCLPHIGSATFETRKKMSEMSIENLLSGVKKGKCKYSVI